MNEDHDRCEMCDEYSDDVEIVMVSMGRDYPGVGGAPAPPERAAVCGDCREAEQERAAADHEAEAAALDSLGGEDR